MRYFIVTHLERIKRLLVYFQFYSDSFSCWGGGGGGGTEEGNSTDFTDKFKTFANFKRAKMELSPHKFGGIAVPCGISSFLISSWDSKLETVFLNISLFVFSIANARAFKMYHS